MKSIPDLVLLAKFCDAVYEPDPAIVANSVNQLGLGFIAQITNGKKPGDQGDCQAVVASWGTVTLLGFRGTQVQNHLSVAELWDDIDLDPIYMGSGMEFAKGFGQPLVNEWFNIRPNIPRGPLILTGHSLGGTRAELAKLFVNDIDPLAQVVSFGAPKCANDAYWQHAFASGSITRVVASTDFAPSWSGIHDWKHPPGQFLWLNGGTMSLADQRPHEPYFMTPTNIQEHSITDSYTKKLVALLPA